MSGSHQRALPPPKQQLQPEHARQSMTQSPNALVMGFSHVTERLLDAFNVQFDHSAAAASAAAAAVSSGATVCLYCSLVGQWLVLSSRYGSWTACLVSSFGTAAAVGTRRQVCQQHLADLPSNDSVCAALATADLTCRVQCSQYAAVPLQTGVAQV